MAWAGPPSQQETAPALQEPTSQAPPPTPTEGAAPEPAPSEDGSALLDRAEAAYAGILLAEARSLAQRAIGAGSLPLEQLRRAYAIIGDTYAIERQPDRARQAYVRLLAVEPRAQPNPELNPQLQSPFFEARAFWNDKGMAIGIDAALLELDGVPTLEFTVRDPMPMAAELRASVTGPSGESEERRFPTGGGTVRWPMPAGTESVTFHASLLDRSGNELHRLGTADGPRVADLPAPPAPPPPRVVAPAVNDSGASAGPSATDEPRRKRSPWLWVGLALGILAVAGATTAIVLTRDPGSDVSVGVSVPNQ